MSYCLNPVCTHPQNSPQQQFCQSCGAKLLLRERYRAIKLIGQGGFGKTFLGVDGDKPSKPPCAIKQFSPSFQGTDSIGKATQLFNQEVERLDSLGEHPQIPELLAHFEQEGKLYLVQEYIAGQNLAQELQEEGVFSETQIRELLKGLLPVLQFIHENNVIHRDIKPENIIRRNNGEYVLVDFGAARYVTGTAILKTGTIIGDVRYMPDEQLQGKAIFASDIYSLGLTCLHLLTQVEPWSLFDSSEGEWIWRDYVPTPVSEKLGQVLDRMVQKATKRRFRSVVEVLEALNPLGVETVIQSSMVETPFVSSEVSSSSRLLLTWIDGKYGYKDKIGKVVIQPQFDDADDFLEGLAAVKLNKKWGFIDKTGKIVIEPQFDGANDFSEGLAAVKFNEKWGYVDKTGRLFPQREKWGYIDKTGKIVAQLQFDDIRAFFEGLAAVKLNEKWGFIDKTGKIVIEPQFDEGVLFYPSFSEGLAAVKLNEKWGFIDKTGKIVIPLQFDDAASFEEGLAKIELNGKYGYIDNIGKIVILPQFDDAGAFSDGKASVKLNGKWGYIDRTGKIVIPLQFDYASSFSEGLAVVELNDKYGYIDRTGKIVIPLQFDDAASFEEGLAKIELNGKYGYIDNTGKIVIPPQFDWAWNFSKGLAEVRLNEKYGYIDKTGQWIDRLS